MTTASELRARINGLESKRLILEQERDALAFEAVVERLPTAVARAAAALFLVAIFWSSGLLG